MGGFGLAAVTGATLAWTLVFPRMGCALRERALGTIVDGALRDGAAGLADWAAAGTFPAGLS